MKAETASETDIAAAFREAMRRHAASVCIISVGSGEAVNGMAVTAASSFSMTPPSMLVCVNESASLAEELREGTPFGITLLGRSQEAVAAAFSRKPSGRPRFDHGAWRLDAELPWLEDAPANIACTCVRMMAFGSHRAVIGLITSVRLSNNTFSLIYRDGVYG